MTQPRHHQLLGQVHTQLGGRRYDRAGLALLAALLAVAVLASGCSRGAASASGDRIPGNTGTESNTLGLDDPPTDEPADPEPTPTGPRPIRVVTLMDESQVLRPLEAPAVAGALARIDEINASGGLLGRPIEVGRFDTESRVSLAQRQVSRLTREPPDLILVGCDVEFTRPILEFADEQGWLTISPCADDIGYSTGAWGSRNFAFGAPAGPRGELAARIALTRYGLSAMILRDRTSPEAVDFCGGFERGFTQAGGFVAFRDEFSYETPEPLLEKLAEQSPIVDFIALCSHVPGGSRGDGAPNIVSQLRFAGFSAPIVSGLSVDEVSWFAQVPSLDEMTYVSWSSLFGNDPNPKVNELISSANSNGSTPNAGVTSVLGYDSVDAWSRAVNNAQSTDADRVTAALGAFVDEPMLSGNMSFVSGSRLDRSRDYRVIRVSDNQVKSPIIETVGDD